MGCVTDPGETPNCSSCQPCSPPSRCLVPDGSSTGPWQTSPVSLMGYPLSLGPKPGNPPEATSSWPPCTPQMGWRNAEGSPEGTPGPWQTSHVFVQISPELGRRPLGTPGRPLQRPEVPAGGRVQPGSWQTPHPTSFPRSLPGDGNQTLRSSQRPQLLASLHCAKTPVGHRWQFPGSLADLPHLVSRISFGLRP